jgi:hypothetical protein
MLHGAIFLATCNAILLLRDVKLPNTSLHYTPLLFSQHIENSSLISLINISLKSRIALQVARKIAPCNMAFTLHYYATGLHHELYCVNQAHNSSTTTQASCVLASHNITERKL